jgi:hypothetical protein
MKSMNKQVLLWVLLAAASSAQADPVIMGDMFPENDEMLLLPDFHSDMVKVKKSPVLLGARLSHEAKLKGLHWSEFSSMQDDSNDGLEMATNQPGRRSVIQANAKIRYAPLDIPIIKTYTP